MCPACLTTIALIAAGTTSTGGLGVLAVKKLRAKSAKPVKLNTVDKGDRHGTTQSGNAR